MAQELQDALQLQLHLSNTQQVLPLLEMQGLSDGQWPAYNTGLKSVLACTCCQWSGVWTRRGYNHLLGRRCHELTGACACICAFLQTVDLCSLDACCCRPNQS